MYKRCAKTGAPRPHALVLPVFHTHTNTHTTVFVMLIYFPLDVHFTSCMTSDNHDASSTKEGYAQKR